MDVCPVLGHPSVSRTKTPEGSTLTSIGGVVISNTVTDRGGLLCFGKDCY